MDSGRYQAEVGALVDQARVFLESRAPPGGKLAIVLDVDETALSNLTSLRANDWGFIVGGPCDLPRGPCGLVAWIAMAQSPPIKPVLALARERGAAVFFLTGRPECLRAVTERNLQINIRSAVELKAAERKKLVDRGYTIIVNMGDQMSDLDGGFAERTYKLPNPFYFVP